MCLLPVPGQSLERLAQHVRGQVLDLHARDQHEAVVAQDPLDVRSARAVVPLQEGIARPQPERRRHEREHTVRERRTAGNPSDRLAYEICVNPGKLAPAKDPSGHQRWQELPQAARRPPKLADEGPDATVRNPEIARFHDNLEKSGSP